MERNITGPLDQRLDEPCHRGFPFPDFTSRSHPRCVPCNGTNRLCPLTSRLKNQTKPKNKTQTNKTKRSRRVKKGETQNPLVSSSISASRCVRTIMASQIRSLLPLCNLSLESEARSHGDFILDSFI